MDRRFTLAGLGVLIVTSLALSLFVVTPTISLDDPFIGLRYVHNMLAGNGLVYNPGEYVEGYTAFGWMMVAAVGMALHIDPLVWWQGCSLVAQAITLVLLWQLGRRPERPPAVALIAPALLAVHLGFVSHSMMGMETSLVTMLATLAVLLVDRGRYRSRRGAIELAVVLLLLCLTRFDAFVFSGIVLVPVLLDQVVVRKRWDSVLAIALVLGIGLGIYNAWRLWYYGALLPNTFYVKVTTFATNVQAGIAYLKGFARDGGPFLLLVPLLPLALVTGRVHRTLALATWIAVMHLAYVMVVGGDWMPYFRFVLPVLPLLCLLLQESLWTLAESGLARWSPRMRHGVLAALAAALLVIDVWPLATSRYVRGPEIPPGAYFVSTHAKRIGQFLDQRLPADARLATEWAGIIPYYVRQPVFDIFGLSDPEIAASDFPGGAMGRQIPLSMLIDRRPDMAIYSGRIYDTPEEAERGIDLRGSSALWIHRFYTQAASEPYFENCVVQIDGGYWPVLLRADWPLAAELCYRKIPAR